jgi:DNA anti-recombination protein RmuC
MKLTKAERSQLETLIAALDKARDELASHMREIADEWQSTFDEKSERWQEGDAGQAAQQRIETLTEMADDLTDSELPDLTTLEE